MLPQFYRGGNKSWERFSNLLKVSKLKVSEPNIKSAQSKVTN